MMGKKHKHRAGDICTVVVHAGAGYHSIANQHVHLKACSDACEAAMTVLKNGGKAVEAVEIAIKILEDREITNAGYGSNLAIDGVVECDALMVDHMGRSGAIGACPQIKNPISLARLVLDKSMLQLTLQRVPPNLLVGGGAVDFAFENGVPVLPYDALVSPGARERWQRWTRDLERAEYKKRHGISSSSPPSFTPVKPRLDTTRRDERDHAAREAHREKMLGYISKRRRVSDSSTTMPSSPPSTHHHMAEPPPAYVHPDTSSETDDTAEEYIDVVGPAPTLHEASTSALINSSQNIPTLLTLEGDRVIEAWAPSIEGSADERMDEDLIDNPISGTRESQDADDESDDDSSNSASMTSTLQLPSVTPSPPAVPSSEGDGHTSLQLPQQGIEDDQCDSTSSSASFTHPRVCNIAVPPPSPRLSPQKRDSRKLSILPDEDLITDTVGAIAIDGFGNIASGASSGGIGMKHRGRMGPAALVGVGAAVVPIHPNDKSKTCVAAVTSGTGEHMGTTLAASVCADRLYSSMQKSNDGLLEEVGEEKVLRGFVEREFMLHPSVKNSISAGAIGIVSIKKTRDGVHLYYAHNTDSFALASMSSDDAEPLTAMSRTRGNATIAEGARAMRAKRKSK